MLVQVTENDIKRGLRGSPWECPIALALQRAFDYRDVGVCSFWLRVGDRKYNHPPNIHEFYTKFDNNEPVEPFEFELN